MDVNTATGAKVVVLVVALIVLYKFVIPYLFPQAAHGVGIVKLKGDDDEQVYAFEGGRVPLVTGDNRSQVKANLRRRKHKYEVAQV